MTITFSISRKYEYLCTRKFGKSDAFEDVASYD